VVDKLDIYGGVIHIVGGCLGCCWYIIVTAYKHGALVYKTWGVYILGHVGAAWDVVQCSIHKFSIERPKF